MWAAGVYLGIDKKLNTKESFGTTEITQLRNLWIVDLNRLMVWLDWGVWVKCDPVCGPTEICYLPTWPVGFPNSPNNQMPSFFDLPVPQERLSDFDSGYTVRTSPAPDEWIRPQPRCINRVDPYEF
ncbi:hypothetical protein JVU11DRAFT_4012 [Chiua virens]|nr:hypothetical protein JVU11DRAFT_4012 [Chiua virens]